LEENDDAQRGKDGKRREGRRKEVNVDVLKAGGKVAKLVVGVPSVNR
jgi:hypothetical protein